MQTSAGQPARSKNWLVLGRAASVTLRRRRMFSARTRGGPALAAPDRTRSRGVRLSACCTPPRPRYRSWWLCLRGSGGHRPARRPLGNRWISDSLPCGLLPRVYGGGLRAFSNVKVTSSASVAASAHLRSRPGSAARRVEEACRVLVPIGSTRMRDPDASCHLHAPSTAQAGSIDIYPLTFCRH